MKSLFLSLFCLVWVSAHNAEILLPPHFNLAENAQITASSTCGENEAQSYLQHSLWYGSDMITLTVCEPENPTNPSANAHPARFALDNSENYWQSPTLRENEQNHQVNLTIDLGQEFSIEWIHITMGKSPRPKVWALERSNDYGATWTKWQYFAENESECKEHFGNLEASITCNFGFSHLKPYQNGEILVPLQVPQQCSQEEDWDLDVWRRTTHIRLRFLRLHTDWVQGLFPDYFYAVKNIKIGGRCACNGHANNCELPYVPWRKTMQCDCQHNTIGDQCQVCSLGYFRPEGSTGFEACQPCNCSEVGSLVTDLCNYKTGQCLCMPGFEGRQCDKITETPFSFDEYLNMIAVD